MKRIAALSLIAALSATTVAAQEVQPQTPVAATGGVVGGLIGTLGTGGLIVAGAAVAVAAAAASNDSSSGS